MAGLRIQFTKMRDPRVCRNKERGQNKKIKMRSQDWIVTEAQKLKK